MTIILILIVSSLLTACEASVESSNSATTKRSTLATTLDLTNEQEAAVLEIFEACGISEIKSVEVFQQGETQTSYHLKDIEIASYRDPIVLWLNNDEKNVDAIYYKDYDLYVDGSVAGNIADYYVSGEERDTYRVAAQMLVKKCLSFPDTAKYEAISGWAFDKQEKKNIAVQSKVKSKNAFGVEYTASFQVIFDEYGSPISLILDGTEYIK